VRIDVIGAVLGIIFDDEDQGVVFIGTVRNFLREQTDGIVVVGHLQAWRVNSVQSGAEATEMIMRESHEGKTRQVLIRDKLIGLTLPFLKQKEISVVLIETAEIQVRIVQQRFLCWDSLLHFLFKWRSGNRNVAASPRIVVAGKVTEHAIVPKCQTGGKHFIPEIAGTASPESESGAATSASPGRRFGSAGERGSLRSGWALIRSGKEPIPTLTSRFLPSQS